MQLNFAPLALVEIKEIHTYIAEQDPLAANRVRDAILIGAQRLLDFPEKGRRGVIEGTRELVLTGVPYVLVYEMNEATQVIEVLNIWHDRQLRF